MRADQIQMAANDETTRRPALRRSVFAKLAIIMVAMAACLVVLFAGFFILVVGPNLHSSVDQVVVAYIRQVVGTKPDLAAAKELHARLGIDVRFEGPDGSWATSPTMATVDDVVKGRVSKWRHVLVPPRNYVVAPAPNGGRYVFAWNLGTRLGEVHFALIMLMIVVIVGVVVTTYVVLNRLLAPLRALNEGVARLSAGELDFRLPTRTRDEFGRLTEAFNQMVNRVRAMIGARDQLLVDVSHELRSPVTRMRVALELSPDHPQREGMAVDLAEMDRMITELLELERLRSGKGLTIDRHDLVAAIRGVVDGFAGRAPGVVLRGPETPLEVAMDVEKIRSVFRNLLENAAKYSRPESRPTEITISGGPDRIVVRVADDGRGIPAPDVERLFEPFYRADRSRSKATGGYGLGLSICKRVMEAHGGDIMLDRSVIRGTAFVVTLPRKTAA